MQWNLIPLGDRACTVEFSDPGSATMRDLIHCVDAALRADTPTGVSAVVPAIRSITMHYNPMQTTLPVLGARLDLMLGSLTVSAPIPRAPVRIPVCYGGEFGPDLESVAAAHDMSCDAVIDAHTAVDYVVAMIGFLPGFPYLDGLSESLHTPRRDIPRTSVPAGSVGIGGGSTGVYPFSSPGGWHLIGRSPRTLFNAHRLPPSLLQAGDHVRFVAIAHDQWDAQVHAA